MTTLLLNTRLLNTNLSPLLAQLRQYRFQLGTLTLLFVLWATFWLLSPATFGSLRIYISFMTSIPFPAILALALTFLIVAQEMDMSFPAIMAFSGYIFATVFTVTGSSFVALVAAMLGGSLAGLTNGLLVVGFGVPSIIATIGTQFFWYGLTTVLASGLAISLVEVRSAWLYDLLVGRLFGWLPMQAIWGVVLAVVAWLMLQRHTFGDNVRFIGDDLNTAKMMGIATGKIRVLLFAMMGLTSALVGVMVCLEMANWWPTQGEGYLLLVFASIFIGGTSVFGGTGTLFGTLIGAIVIGMIESGIIAVGLSGFWTRMVYGLIIVISVSVYACLMKANRR